MFTKRKAWTTHFQKRKFNQNLCFFGKEEQVVVVSYFQI
jgi:hypothetical protein